jgi:hypothetical protein
MDIFSLNFSISNLTEILLVEAALIYMRRDRQRKADKQLEGRTDGRKDGRTKSVIHFNREKGLYGD